MERLQAEIAQQQSKSDTYKQEKASKEQAITIVLLSLHGLRLLANPLSVPENDPEKMLAEILKDIKNVVRKFERYRVLEKADEETVSAVLCWINNLKL